MSEAQAGGAAPDATAVTGPAMTPQQEQERRDQDVREAEEAVERLERKREAFDEALANAREELALAQERASGGQR
jgi:outer membrane murein-binding lipoprotein Lpp